MPSPLDGHQRDAGKEDDPRQPGAEWWKESETKLAGSPGPRPDGQQQTETSGEGKPKPYVPQGTERTKC